MLKFECKSRPSPCRQVRTLWDFSRPTFQQNYIPIGPLFCDFLSIKVCAIFFHLFSHTTLYHCFTRNERSTQIDSAFKSIFYTYQYSPPSSSILPVLFIHRSDNTKQQKKQQSNSLKPIPTIPLHRELSYGVTVQTVPLELSQSTSHLLPKQSHFFPSNNRCFRMGFSPLPPQGFITNIDIL